MLYVINQKPDCVGFTQQYTEASIMKKTIQAALDSDSCEFIIDRETANCLSDLMEDIQIPFDIDWEVNIIGLDDRLEHGDEVMGVDINARIPPLLLG